MANIIKKMQLDAEMLYKVRKEIADLEETNKKNMEILKQRRDDIQEILLEQMTKHGLASLKVKSGDSFAKATRKSLEVVSEVGALKWALDNKCYALNKIVAMQKLKDATKIPDCFDVVSTDYISVRKGKTNGETE